MKTGVQVGLGVLVSGLWQWAFAQQTDFAGRYVVNNNPRDVVTIAAYGNRQYRLSSSGWEGVGIFDGKRYFGVYRYADSHPDKRFVGVWGTHHAERAVDGSLTVEGRNTIGMGGGFCNKWSKGVRYVRLQHDGQCLSATSSGARQQPCRTDLRQQWTLRGQCNPYHLLISRQSGQCLVATLSHGVGLSRCQWSLATMQWSLVRHSGGGFQLVSRHTGQCLTGVPGGDQLQQTPCSAGPQRWSLRVLPE